MKPGVIVAHPNVQHSLQLAVALQKHELLEVYLTRLYASTRHSPFNHLERLPSTLRSRILHSLLTTYRRSHPELDAAKIEVIDPLITLAIIAARRLGLVSASQWDTLLRRSSQRFQRAAATIAVARHARALVCYDRFALHAFEALEDTGIARVLDMSIAHPAALREILLEERERFPQFERSLSVAGVTDDDFAQTVDEAMLADLVLVGSEFVRDTCVSNGVPANRIRVVPYGIDPNRFRSPPRDVGNGPLRVLFVGQIGQRKGITYLLDACRALGPAKIALKLCGTLIDGKEALADYDGHFEYVGYVPHSKIHELYLQSDIFVLPTLAEGLSQVCLEAMASGLPVITTTHSGLAGIIEDGENGFIVPIRSAEAVADRLDHLYQARDRILSMGQAARTTASRFTWERYHGDVSKVLEEFVSVPRASDRFTHYENQG